MQSKGNLDAIFLVTGFPDLLNSGFIHAPSGHSNADARRSHQHPFFHIWCFVGFITDMYSNFGKFKQTWVGANVSWDNACHATQAVLNFFSVHNRHDIRTIFRRIFSLKKPQSNPREENCAKGGYRRYGVRVVC